MKCLLITALMVWVSVVQGQSIINLQFVPSYTDSVKLRVFTSFGGSPSDEMYKYSISKSSDTIYLKLYYDNRGMRAGVLSARADTCYVGKWTDSFNVITVTPFVFSFVSTDTSIYVDDTVAYSQSKSIQRTLSASHVSTKREIDVYPNPVRNTLHIKADEEMKSITIFSIHGRLLKRISGHLSSMDISFLAPGCYFVRFDFEGEVATRTLVKE